MKGQPCRRRAAIWAAVGTAAVLLGAVACSSNNRSQSGTSGPSSKGAGPKLAVVATINAWGSIAAQLGGDRVQETSIITNPDTDPHQWYSPDSVTNVANAITAAYKKADPNDSGYFDQLNQQFLNQALSNYHSLIASIKAKYAGTPVGASESIFSPLSDALALNLITPPEFLKAISEGTDPSPADKATIDRQIATKAIKVYVFNSQNNNPDVQAQVDVAKKQGIPVTTVTETLSPANASFQDWQSTQLSGLADALHAATGK